MNDPGARGDHAEPRGRGVADDVGIPAGRSVFADQPAYAESQGEPRWADPDSADPATAEAALSGRSEPRLVEAGPDEMEVWTDQAGNPQWADETENLPPMEPHETVGDTHSEEDFFDYSDLPSDTYTSASTRSDRDMPMAILIGVILASAILAAMRISPVAAVVVSVVVLALAAAELLNVLRRADYQPAILLGLASVVCMPLAVYWRGLPAVTVVMVLTVVFGAVWYLTGSVESPLRGLASTVMTVAYIGILGSHAALILAVPDAGTGVLTAAIVFTIAYDVGAFTVGRAAGRNPLSAASPNKTLEGLAGGCLATVAVGVVMGLLAMPAPIADAPGDLMSAVILALAAAVAAPIGDLAESLIKRDLNIKDMSQLLPGHGGVLDRFDGLLFVLPTTYYAALLVGVI